MPWTTDDGSDDTCSHSERDLAGASDGLNDERNVDGPAAARNERVGLVERDVVPAARADFHVDGPTADVDDRGALPGACAISVHRLEQCKECDVTRLARRQVSLGDQSRLHFRPRQATGSEIVEQ